MVHSRTGLPAPYALTAMATIGGKSWRLVVQPGLRGSLPAQSRLSVDYRAQRGGFAI
ncbi:hypothetical protein L681_11120 [Stenotrophomonas maltophilia MF89]|nr:hypothetical protein L681_11120 [Stenotrophomonas maltophilia MF89]